MHAGVARTGRSCGARGEDRTRVAALQGRSSTTELLRRVNVRVAMAEEEGFGPPEACTSRVFRTRAFGRSATPPRGARSRSRPRRCVGVPLSRSEELCLDGGRGGRDRI